MTAWTALLRKELLLFRPVFLTVLFMELAAMLAGPLMSSGLHIRYAATTIGLMLIVLHFLYLCLYPVAAYLRERKTMQLWLQHPLPGGALLAAKLLAGLAFILVSYLIVLTYTWAAMSADGTLSHFAQLCHPYRLALLVSAGMLGVGLESGIDLLFFWILLHVLRSRIGNWAWLLAAGLFILNNYTTSFIEKTPFMRWGPLPHSFYSYWISDRLHSGISLYAGDFVFDLLMTLLCFLIGAWLLDHLLEVS
ncbi:MAG: hypothetical protein ABF868_11095 [Sporolactobacillus sp.]